jgi:hypothetical protein
VATKSFNSFFIGSLRFLTKKTAKRSWQTGSGKPHGFRFLPENRVVFNFSETLVYLLVAGKCSVTANCHYSLPPETCVDKKLFMLIFHKQDHSALRFSALTIISLLHLLNIPPTQIILMGSVTS